MRSFNILQHVCIKMKLGGGSLFFLEFYSLKIQCLSEKSEYLVFQQKGLHLDFWKAEVFESSLKGAMYIFAYSLDLFEFGCIPKSVLQKLILEQDNLKDSVAETASRT